MRPNRNMQTDSQKTDSSAALRCGDGFGTSRAARVARIKHAESLGYKRCEPYACIGVKKPRWYWQGGYYDFDELPSLPNASGQPRRSKDFD